MHLGFDYPVFEMIAGGESNLQKKKRPLIRTLLALGSSSRGQ
jgi:hypothetical protein